MRLEDLFVQILKAALYGTLIAAVVLALKFMLGGRIGAKWNYYIWALLLLRLMFPVFFQSGLSLYNYIDVPKTPVVLSGYTSSLTPALPHNITVPGPVKVVETSGSYNTDNDALERGSQSGAGKTDLIPVLSKIWLITAGLYIIYSLSCAFYLSHIVSKSSKYTDPDIHKIFDECRGLLRIKKNIALIKCSGLSSPCIYGIFHPKLLISPELMTSMNDEEKRYVFMHELTHYIRGDTYINMLVILLRSVYWFNPVFWFCFIQIRKDCELACDEAVLSGLAAVERYRYAQTILAAASFGTKSTAPYPIIGLVDNTKGTKHRIKRICKYKKRSVLWIAAGLLITLLLGIFLLTDKKDNDPGIDTANDISAAFERLTQNPGYTSEQVFELSSDDRTLIISKGRESVDYLFGIIDSIRDGSKSGSVYIKYIAEALISEIFLKNAGDELIYYRKEDIITIANTNALGRTGPGTEYEVWSHIPENSLIRLTGMLDMDWWRAKMVSSVDINNNILTDGIEFWIHRDDFETTIIHDGKVGFFLVNTNDAQEYRWIISSPDEKAGLYTLPDQNSSLVGKVSTNDLIRVKVKRDLEPLQVGEWILIDYIPYDSKNNNVTTAWIRSEYVVLRPQGHISNQGFILRNTQVYEAPDHASPKLQIQDLKYLAIACIQILEASDDWLKISAGDTFTGWVIRDDVYFTVTDEVMQAVHYPDPDFDIFISYLKEQILDNSSFVIKAEDTDDVLVPDTEQRNLLSSALTRIESYQIFDGGITEAREAAYPFYRLDFDDHSMVITTDDSLLLLMGTNRAYDYGVGRQGAIIRFVTPNAGFINTLKDLMGPIPNNDINDFNFLMNARSVSFISDDFSSNNSEESTLQVHINKVARALKQSCGNEIGTQKPETDSGQTVIIEFGFSDGHKIRVTYTDGYIEYNGWYYEPLQPVHHFMATLFAAYF